MAGKYIKMGTLDTWVGGADVALFQAAAKAKVRHDWHEPDEQDLTATVRGTSFDNAGTENEKRVIVKKEGRPIGKINLATLLSLGMELLRREGLLCSTCGGEGHPHGGPDCPECGRG